jgi:hypothetical protein
LLVKSALVAGGVVTTVAFTADDARVVATVRREKDGDVEGVRIWRTLDGERLNHVPTYVDERMWIAFERDDLLVLGDAGGRMTRWDLSSCGVGARPSSGTREPDGSCASRRTTSARASRPTPWSSATTAGGSQLLTMVASQCGT